MHIDLNDITFPKLLKAQAAAHALRKVSLGRREGPGERRFFTHLEPAYETPGAKDSVGIELLLDAPHQVEGGGRVAEDIDLALEYRVAADHNEGSAQAAGDGANTMHELLVGAGA